MDGGKKFVALMAALAIIVTPLVGATAQSRTYHRHFGYRPLYRPVPMGYWNYPSYSYGYGYNDGWRLRSNARGWDNTCINAPWLPSQFACSAK